MKRFIYLIIFFFGFSAHFFISKNSSPRNQGKRIYVDMVADLFHPGHIQFLKNAKKQGDYLIVGLNSDQDVASYKRVPILNIHERAQMVESCKYVDEVLLNCPLKVTKDWIRKHRIDLVIHGDDFDKDTIYDFYKDAIELKRFKTIPYTEGISTTQLIQRIKNHLP